MKRIWAALFLGFGMLNVLGCGGGDMTAPDTIPEATAEQKAAEAEYEKNTPP